MEKDQLTLDDEQWIMSNEQGSMINDRWSIKINDEQWAINDKEWTRINDQWTLTMNNEQGSMINEQRMMNTK